MSSTPSPGRIVRAGIHTGIYCRPRCQARPWTSATAMFFGAAAHAEAAGFTACELCRPARSPATAALGAANANLVSQALHLIHDGVAEDSGVRGLAGRLGVTETELRELMMTELGTGPEEINRVRQVRAAQLLLVATDLSTAGVALAAGYASEKQCSDAVQAALGSAPADLRNQSVGIGAGCDIALRLHPRLPYTAAPLMDFLRARTIKDVEEFHAGTYRRTVRLRRYHGVLTARPQPRYLRVRLRLGDVADLPEALQLTRRLFDLDADPEAIATALGADPLLAPLIKRRPGIRVPGQVDGFELAVRAVLGQQITVRGARTMAGRLVDKLGDQLRLSDRTLSRIFPTAEAIATDDLSGIGLTSARVRALRALAEAVADGRVTLEPGVDRDATVRTLLGLPGIGPWTTAYIAMRALGDPDAIPLTDLGIRQAVRSLGVVDDAKELARRSESWRPWRSYAALHLWAHLGDATAGDGKGDRRGRISR